jgi:uncharacterized protein with LGFP repeats
MERRSSGGEVRESSGVPRRGRFPALLLALVTAVTGLSALAPAPSASALNGFEFSPGYIISDDLFYDGSAMTASEIQSFLNGKIGTCQNGRCLNVATLPVTTRSASYSSETGALVCAAITGGNLSVSELIYRTQVACGISAKVILVTLQKEQGLVTSRAPSDWALKAAMGMGCPDTAPCNEAFAGLANQIMSGTRQLKVYKVGHFARQPGIHFIQYSPNASCGGTNVDIRNYATAALYNYTPYQPNAAALANLGGTGNSCSSYGNRNFWAYYTNWFGSTTGIPCAINPTRDITRYWEEHDAADGPLGAPTSPGIVPGPAGTTIGTYANGEIYCTTGLGAAGIVGEMRIKYAALGGPSGSLGSPLSLDTPFSAGGVAGSLQEFEHGTMVHSPVTGTFAVLHGPMREAWGARGGSAGSLGWPTGDQVNVSGGAWQAFEHGVLIVPRAGAAIVLDGEIGRYWSAGSNATKLGLPLAAATTWNAGGVSGLLQYFEKGMVLSSAATGTFAVLDGPMRSAWGATGGSGGSAGWPTSDQVETALGLSQEFHRGTLFATDSGAGGTMSGTIASYWAADANGERLGLPVSSPTLWSAGGVTGTLQYFERGMVLSSTSTGTYSVMNGPMRDAWGVRGGSGGPLGWPIADQQASGDLQQQFQHGVLTVKTGLSGDIAEYWSAGSNSARLGSPNSAPTSFAAGGVTGTLQYFERGMVLSSSTTGTFGVLNGEFRGAWGATGGSGGSLGWPIGDQESISGGTRQVFQHGAIVVPSGGVGVVLSGEIGAYWTSGSNSARLGSPTSAPTPFAAGGVTGNLQYFERGMVLSSSTTGTFGVLNGEFRNAWGATGGSGGSLGWPIGDQESISGGTRQVFQRGTIIVPTGGAGVVLSGEIGAYWASGSNGAMLGSPSGSPSSLTAGGVTGLMQIFQRGTVLSSPATGTYAVLNGPIRTAWGTSGGTSGTLGWPTSDQQVFAGGVRQTFQRGMVAISSDGIPITLEGAFYTYWSSGSNASILGSPLAPPLALTAGGVSGSYQVFEHGMVLSSTTTGTFAVQDGPIRTVWGGVGGSGGSLGWPIGDQSPVTGGVSQPFQRGSVMVPTSGTPYIVPD